LSLSTEFPTLQGKFTLLLLLLLLILLLLRLLLLRLLLLLPILCYNESTLLENIQDTYILCKFSISFFSTFLGAFAKLQKVTIKYVMSVRLTAWNESAPAGRIFMKADIWVFFENMSRKFKFH